ncbi:Pao retrotransposon peptidase family protein [Dirofilaria immitis]|nr:Pao retrotransposon peptidase family protein [Dirofilaria immitis]
MNELCKGRVVGTLGDLVRLRVGGMGLRVLKRKFLADENEWKKCLRKIEAFVNLIDSMFGLSSLLYIIKINAIIDELNYLSSTKIFGATSRDLSQPKKIARDKRPCAFCNKDHWDNECSTYPTLKQPMEYLRKNNACLNCLRMGHATNNCNKKKRSCFHCKNPHNTALFYVKYGMQTAESRNSPNVINSIAQSTHQQGQEI